VATTATATFRLRSDREVARSWAQEVASDPFAVFLDTETTGIGPAAEVIDLAVIGGDGEVVLETLVRPRCPIPPDATRIHGIADADVAGAPAWEQVYPYLVAAIGQRRVVVYNADFDRGVIAGVCRSCGLAFPLSRWDCAMQAYAAFVGELSSGRSRQGYRWFKLDDAARAFGIEPGGHRAAADARVCRAVVHAMAGSVM
jgi:DNA polymerase-3 subunit epsilon